MPAFSKISKEEEFWSWFQKNEDSIFNFERDQQHVFSNLQKALHKVNRELAFEFSPVIENKREFVISAGGIKSAFPAVESLFKSAPVLPKWIWVKFRPRREPGTLMMGDVKVGPEDIEISMKPHGEKTGLHVFVKGYNQAKSRVYSQLAFIFLDHTIGEYDMETKIGFIEIHPFEEAGPDKRYGIQGFPAVFDEFVNSRNPESN